MDTTLLTLVLVVEGPMRLAARILAARYPEVRCGSGALSVSLGSRETPEGVLAFCRDRRIGIRASYVLSRAVVHRAEEACRPSSPLGATGLPSTQEVVQ